MNEKTKMTRQGIRDLNDYGPRRPTASPATVAPTTIEATPIVPATPEAPEPPTVGEIETAAESKA